MSFINESEDTKNIKVREYIDSINQELHADYLKKAKSDQETYDYWTQEIKNFTLGYTTAIKVLNENQSILNSEEFEDEPRLEDCLIRESEIEMLNDVNIIKQIISGASTLQKLWNKSSNVLTAYYIVANQLFDQKKFVESHNVFSFLTLINQNIQCFWMGKGAANESQENWDKALSDYWMAQSINPQEALVYEALIRIYKKLQDEESLQECFSIIENYPDLKKQLLGKES